MTEIALRLRSIKLPNYKSVWVLNAVILIALAIFDQPQLSSTVAFAFDALSNTFPYIVFAVFLIAGLIATGAETVLSRAFEGKENRMIIFASLLGGLAPFCSCEVIPFIAALLAAGTPVPAVMAFWLSSPLIDPPSLMITASALGWEFAVAKAIAAVAIGLFGGFATKTLIDGFGLKASLREGGVSGCGCGASPLSGKPVWAFWTESDRVRSFWTAGVENLNFLLKWLALAYVLESLMVAYVPAEFIGGIVGGQGLLPIMLSAVLGAPAYLNSYAAPALVSGLLDQGMTIGAGMAFMISGAITSIPAMTAVFALVKRDIFILYVGLGFTGAVLSGVIYGAFAG